ncbi:MAG: type II toxin-antitoxin system Phd/YefM family antitoxin [Planctomycetes bacterium]|nr:type II toxin-antitoxin system Phd/YefM family antitoxin [Planctomycetota bacterium]
MRHPRLDEDLKPLSEFRANAAACIQQVQKTKRPLVITLKGKSAAVLIDVSEYETLLDRIDLLEDVRTGEAQIDAGKGLPHRKALDTVRKNIRR